LFGSTCSSASAIEGGSLPWPSVRATTLIRHLPNEEVLTVYVFGLIKKRTTISEIHKYAEEHFSDWFPDLHSY